MMWKLLKKVEALGYKKEEILDWFQRVSTKVLDHKPEDITIATHFCKGNFKGNPYCIDEEVQWKKIDLLVSCADFLG